MPLVDTSSGRCNGSHLLKLLLQNEEGVRLLLLRIAPFGLKYFNALVMVLHQDMAPHFSKLSSDVPVAVGRPSGRWGAGLDHPASMQESASSEPGGCVEELTTSSSEPPLHR